MAGPARLLGSLLSALRRFARGRTAVAAVEFAFIFPVALVLYAGVAEVSDAVMTSRNVSNVTRTMVDLLSKQPTATLATSTPAPPNAVTADTLSTLMKSAATLLYPKPTGPLQMTLTAVDIVNTSSGTCCTATVRWSLTQNGTLRPCGVQLTGMPDTAVGLTTLPNELLPVGAALPQPVSLLIADVSYPYQPSLSSAILPFATTMQRTEYMMPRTTGQVVTGPLPTAGGQTGQVCY